jgi:hypothetical protein
MTADDVTLTIKEDESKINPTSYDSREMLLVKLDEVIDFLHHKALKGRIVKPENEKVRIQWFKAMTYACSIYNQIKRDVEIDELNNKVLELTEKIEEINRRSRT